MEKIRTLLGTQILGLFTSEPSSAFWERLAIVCTGIGSQSESQSFLWTSGKRTGKTAQHFYNLTQQDGKRERKGAKCSSLSDTGHNMITKQLCTSVKQQALRHSQSCTSTFLWGGVAKTTPAGLFPSQSDVIKETYCLQVISASTWSCYILKRGKIIQQLQNISQIHTVFSKMQYSPITVSPTWTWARDGEIISVPFALIAFSINQVLLLLLSQGLPFLPVFSAAIQQRGAGFWHVR